MEDELNDELYDELNDELYDELNELEKKILKKINKLNIIIIKVYDNNIEEIIKKNTYIENNNINLEVINKIIKKRFKTKYVKMIIR